MPKKKLNLNRETLRMFITEDLSRIEEMLAAAVAKLLKEELKKLLEVVNEKAIPGPQGKPGEKPLAGKDFHVPSEESIIKSVLAQIPPPKPGKDADETKIVFDVLNRIPKPKDGEDGTDGSPDTPEEIRDKLLTLKEAWIEVSMIKREGLTELIRQSLPPTFGGGGGGMGDVETELFTITQDTETVETAHPIGNSGKAVMNSTYRGQGVDLDIHFTVGNDLRTITFNTEWRTQLQGQGTFKLVYVR